MTPRARHALEPSAARRRALVGMLGVFATALLLAAPAAGYMAYSQDPVANTGYCAHCHGDFNSGSYVSLKDGTAWGSSLMNGHMPFVSFDCQACHMNFGGSTPVSLHSSTSATFPLSCTGCHGRAEDAGVPTGVPVVYPTSQSGAGLRQHHFLANTIVNGTSTQVCATCHADADPANTVTAGEDILPFNHQVLGWDPCADAQFGPTGLDNDGDGVDDGADLDCGGNQGTDNPDEAHLCGNDVVEGPEQCDDGNAAIGDCCSPTCGFLNGPGTPPCCDQGACQVGQGCGAVCFAQGGVCAQPGGPGTPCNCVLP